MIAETIEQLKTIIAEQLDVNIRRDEIDVDAPIFEGGLGLDSVAIVELITAIEQTFAIQFGDDDLNMEPFQSLRTLAWFIQEGLTRSPIALQEIAGAVVQEAVHD